MKKGSAKQKDGPASEDVVSGRSVRSRTSAPSEKSQSSSLRLVPIVLVNSQSSKAKSVQVASSSRLSPNVSSQPSMILLKLERIQEKFGKDMMTALVEIARVRVQVEELRRAEEGSACASTDGDGANDD